MAETAEVELDAESLASQLSDAMAALSHYTGLEGDELTAHLDDSMTRSGRYIAPASDEPEQEQVEEPEETPKAEEPKRAPKAKAPNAFAGRTKAETKVELDSDSIKDLTPTEFRARRSELLEAAASAA